MKYATLLSLVISAIVFSQHSSNAQDSTAVNPKTSITELNNLKQELRNQNEKTQLLLAQSERNFELASKIIDWSAMFFATLVIFLGIAGWIGARRFKQIDEAGKEMSATLELMKVELLKMQQLRNENQKAIEELKAKFERDRKELMEVIYYMNQGENAYESGELKNAIKIYTKVINLKPDSPEAQYMLGTTYSANSDYPKAIEHLKQAIELRPNYYEAFYSLGRTYRRYGDLDLSIKCLEKALELNPEYTGATTNLGHTYLRKRELSKAIYWYEKSIEIDPDASLPYLCLARIAYQQGEIEKAITLYKTAKEKIDKIESEGKLRYWQVYHLGEMCLVFGDAKEAESYYNRAFAMNAAKETLRSMKYNLDLLKASPSPPKDIDSFIKFFDDKLEH
jgi:tetratricopeptide (TPR) repeat protein